MSKHTYTLNFDDVEVIESSSPIEIRPKLVEVFDNEPTSNNTLHIYVRSSTNDPKHLSEQVEMGREVSDLCDMKYHTVWSETDSENQPVLNELLTSIENDEVKTLWVQNLDRFTRDQDKFRFICNQYLFPKVMWLVVGYGDSDHFWFDLRDSNRKSELLTPTVGRLSQMIRDVEKSLDRKPYDLIQTELEKFFSFNDLKPDHDYIVKFDNVERVFRINTVLGLSELDDDEVRSLPPLTTYEWLGKGETVDIYTRRCGFDWEEWT